MKQHILVSFVTLASALACSEAETSMHGVPNVKVLHKADDTVADSKSSSSPGPYASVPASSGPDAATFGSDSPEPELSAVLDPSNEIILEAALPSASLSPNSASTPNAAPAAEPDLSLTPAAEPGLPAAPALAAPVLAAITLEVKVSSPEVREGGKDIQAQALLSRAPESEVLWTLEGPAGLDLGTIDTQGKYTSPASITGPLTVQIVGTLANDSKVTGKTTISVIPVEQLFVGCRKGNLEFPISADVFQLPVNTAKLPSFSALTKSDRVCLDKFDIPNQSWELGFPGAASLQEWFALHSTSMLVISQPGSYSFKIISDDGANVYINGTKLIDNDGNHSAKAATGTIDLAAGKQSLVLDWYQGPRTYIALQLFWKTPGSSDYVIVPSSAFAAQ